MAAAWLQTGSNCVLAKRHGPFTAFGKHFIGPSLHSGGLPACPAGAGSPRGAEMFPPVGTRTSLGERTFLCVGRFPRAGKTPRGREGEVSQSGRLRAPRCSAGRFPPAGRTFAPVGRMSPRGGRRSPRGLLTSPCSEKCPPGMKRAFPYGMRPFCG